MVSRAPAAKAGIRVHVLMSVFGARLTIIAELDDVLRDVGEVESWLAGRGSFGAGRTPVFPRNR